MKPTVVKGLGVVSCGNKEIWYLLLFYLETTYIDLMI